MTNKFQGLARGPIDHQSSSVINVIANGVIEMGSSVDLVSSITSDEILPRVEETTGTGDKTYGVAVGGDADGIYSTTGAQSGTDLTRATTGAGQGVVIVTQGRCPARVNGSSPTVAVGDPLTPSNISGILVRAPSGTPQNIIARALSTSTQDDDIIPVDIQREGNVSQT